MNTKTIVAGLLAGLVALVFGGLVYGMLLATTFAELSGSASGVTKSNEEMMSGINILYLILGHLTLGLFLAYIYSKWANISTVAGGAKAGAIIGSFMAISWDLITLATTNVTTLQGVILDVVIGIIMMSLAGAVVGWWLGRS